MKRDISKCYLGGHNPVVTEFGGNEGLGAQTRPMSYIDCPAVHSLLISSKLQNIGKQVQRKGRKKDNHIKVCLKMKTQNACSTLYQNE